MIEKGGLAEILGYTQCLVATKRTSISSFPEFVFMKRLEAKLRSTFSENGRQASILRHSRGRTRSWEWQKESFS
jgi:hypothetical protein